MKTYMYNYQCIFTHLKIILKNIEILITREHIPLIINP